MSARISEPNGVAEVLDELRLESTCHLGRLDLEEWSEMMMDMRRGGVALGYRNKLRFLVATSSTGAGAAGASSVGPCRAQAGPGEQESTNERTSRHDILCQRRQCVACSTVALLRLCGVRL